MIDLSKLERFVAACEETQAIHAELQTINMKETELPSCKTPGCHAGIILAALNHIGVPPTNPFHYNYSQEAMRLSRWLFPLETESHVSPHRTLLCLWAKINPDIWGNEYGVHMFSSPWAFGQETDSFPGKVIVEHWKAVLARAKATQEKG